MTRRPHILVIDQSPSVLELFQELLTEEGYCVSRQARLDGGVGIVLDVNPDLLILDYQWNTENDNWSSLRQLRVQESTKHLPIILCTTAVQEAMAFRDDLDELNIRVVLKPFEIDYFLSEVAAALAKP